jgi:hypothetical protein
VVFIESHAFTRRLQALAGDSADSVLRAIQDELLGNPEKGDMIKGLSGVRKARSSNPGRGKGKRGGFRYLYLYLAHRSHLHLLFVLDKNEQEDLSSDDRSRLRELAARIKGM